jgi:peptidoglycan/LPS O-acetylase OafA/YrhL
MDSLFLLQFACFIFMFINAFIVALSCLHVRWKNKRYERSRWMIAAAITGLAIQYVIQMKFGFRAIDDDLGAVINILIYTPCFSLICMGIYNLETTRANRRKMYLVCGAIYTAIILIFCVGVSLHQSLYIREELYLMLVLFCVSVSYCIYDYTGDEQAQEDAGNDGGYGYAALREIFTSQHIHPLSPGPCLAGSHVLHHLIIYTGSCGADGTAVL